MASLPGCSPVKAGQLAAQVGALVRLAGAPTWAASTEARDLAENAPVDRGGGSHPVPEVSADRQAYRRETCASCLAGVGGANHGRCWPGRCTAYIAFLRAVPVE